MSRKRFLTKRGFADAANIGIGSVTKAIKNGWIELSEHPSFEGDFIDTNEYKPKDYFSHIAVCQKKKAEAKRLPKFPRSIDTKIIPNEKLIQGQEKTVEAGQKSA